MTSDKYIEFLDLMIESTRSGTAKWYADTNQNIESKIADELIVRMWINQDSLMPNLLIDKPNDIPYLVMKSSMFGTVHREMHDKLIVLHNLATKMICDPLSTHDAVLDKAIEAVARLK